MNKTFTQVFPLFPGLYLEAASNLDQVSITISIPGVLPRYGKFYRKFPFADGNFQPVAVVNRFDRWVRRNPEAALKLWEDKLKRDKVMPYKSGKDGRAYNPVRRERPQPLVVTTLIVSAKAEKEKRQAEERFISRIKNNAEKLAQLIRAAGQEVKQERIEKAVNDYISQAIPSLV